MLSCMELGVPNRVRYEVVRRSCIESERVLMASSGSDSIEMVWRRARIDEYGMDKRVLMA